MEKRVAPWPDYEGNPIREGDTICHPDGDQGDVYRLPDVEDPCDAWRVDYGDGYPHSRLCLQIGWKGQAVVVGSPQNASQ
ncbi:hypothetical protein [Burkholderia glumae]|uniref:hypothetical protein n=1 Tax=Burkholderia glumae TaxID=337 RepID=UPI003B9A2105